MKITNCPIACVNKQHDEQSEKMGLFFILLCFVLFCFVLVVLFSQVSSPCLWLTYYNFCFFPLLMAHAFKSSHFGSFVALTQHFRFFVISFRFHLLSICCALVFSCLALCHSYKSLNILLCFVLSTTIQYSTNWSILAGLRTCVRSCVCI